MCLSRWLDPGAGQRHRYSSWQSCPQVLPCLRHTGRCLDCAMQLVCMHVCVHLCVCVSTHTWSLTNNWKTHNLQNQPQPVLLPTPNWITACISMKQQRREHWKRTFFRRWNQPLHSNLTWANLQPSFQLTFNEQLLCIRNGVCSDLIGSLPLSLINISPVF